MQSLNLVPMAFSLTSASKGTAMGTRLAIPDYFQQLFLVMMY